MMLRLGLFWVRGAFGAHFRHAHTCVVRCMRGGSFAAVHPRFADGPPFLRRIRPRANLPRRQQDQESVRCGYTMLVESRRCGVLSIKGFSTPRHFDISIGKCKFHKVSAYDAFSVRQTFSHVGLRKWNCVWSTVSVSLPVEPARLIIARRITRART